MIIIGSFLIASNSAGAMIQGFFGENVAIVLNNYASPYLIYGVPIDVIFYKGEWYLILKTDYREVAEQFIKLKNIHSIRKRYKNE